MPVITCWIAGVGLVVWLVCEGLDRIEEAITNRWNRYYLDRLKREAARSARNGVTR